MNVLDAREVELAILVVRDVLEAAASRTVRHGVHLWPRIDDMANLMLEDDTDFMTKFHATQR